MKKSICIMGLSVAALVLPTTVMADDDDPLFYRFGLRGKEDFVAKISACQAATKASRRLAGCRDMDFFCDSGSAYKDTPEWSANNCSVLYSISIGSSLFIDFKQRDWIAFNKPNGTSATGGIYVLKNSFRKLDSQLSEIITGMATAPDGQPGVSLSSTVINCSNRTMAIAAGAFFDSSARLTGKMALERHKWDFTTISKDIPFNAVMDWVCVSSAPGENQNGSSGSGFYVNASGNVITNAHVVENCKDIQVRQGKQSYPATLVARDRIFDLALLKTKASQPAPQVRSRPIEVGDAVYASGFPLSTFLGSELNFTDGKVSSLKGIGGNATNFQITAPVQPGNSGGPLIDKSGNIAGVVVAKLNAIKVAAMTGDIPQNINFAIKSDVLRIFLDGNDVIYNSAASDSTIDPVAIAKKARTFTVQVQCRM